jgi:hypothetical protein
LYCRRTGRGLQSSVACCRLSRAASESAKLVRRFAAFTNQYPWQWEPAEAEAFITHSPVAVSTARNYQNTLRLFCGYASDARYGWTANCLEHFGSAPRQILDEWNTVTRALLGLRGNQALPADLLLQTDLPRLPDPPSPGDSITHDLLDDLPQTQALHYVREMLVNSGVLPVRNEHLERLAPWLEYLLRGKPAHHARLIRPFTHWFVFRRARRTATRRAVRYFLPWAHGRGLARDLNVPLPPRQEPERLLAESDHIQQLDRCLTDEDMPLDLRVAGALVLLFGMLVSRITQ